MQADDIRVRRLLPEDAARYREIRLEGLRVSPEAFGNTFEAENARPIELFADRIRDSETMGAFEGAEILGVAGLRANQGPKESHKGMLVGMYVRPQARNRGVGRRLVEAVIEVACTRGVELLQLAVVSDNEPARRLYARLGFVEYGIEKKSLKQGGRYTDEVLMVKDFSLESR
ncbi:MAG TPA: GNAT family N-acetyltransferase [Candidatus Eremiobacteraceae bacterium]|nr:GNAT family N-acetyltransferase [Candidatus Eremiobacteraceae bacterium]